jgi:hypothetical protein
MQRDFSCWVGSISKKFLHVKSFHKKKRYNLRNIKK